MKEPIWDKDDSIPPFFNKTTEVILYSKIYVQCKYALDLLINLADQAEEKDLDDEGNLKNPPNIEEIDGDLPDDTIFSFEELQNFLSLKPEFVDNKDISLSIVKDCHPDSFEIKIHYNIKNNKDEWKKALKIQNEKNKTSHDVYIKEKSKYDLFLLEEKIKKLQKEAEKLKNNPT